MSTPPVAAIEGEKLPDPLSIPAEVIADLTAAAEGQEESSSAVQRLKDAIGTNTASVKARERDNQLVALIQAGHTQRKIGELLGLKPNAVRVALWRARHRGVLNDLRSRLEHDTTALAIDTVNYHIKTKKSESAAIEHLRGMGFYKNHSNVKNEGGGAGGFQMPPLQVNVVVQNNQGAAHVTPETFDVSEGAIGVPREDS